MSTFTEYQHMEETPIDVGKQAANNQEIRSSHRKLTFCRPRWVAFTTIRQSKQPAYELVRIRQHAAPTQGQSKPAAYEAR